MFRRKLMLFAMPLVAATAALVAGCSSSSPSWNKTSMQTKADANQTPYVFYQHDQVLYEPYARNYFWQDGDHWFQGKTLPAGRTLSQDKPVIVYMPSNPPFEYFRGQISHKTAGTWAQRPGLVHQSAIYVPYTRKTTFPGTSVSLTHPHGTSTHRALTLDTNERPSTERSPGTAYATAGEAQTLK